MRGEDSVDLCVAGLPISVESADEAYFHERFAAYVRTDDRAPVMTMRTRLVEDVAVPCGELVEEVDRVQIVHLPDGRLCRYVHGYYPDGRRGPVLFSVAYTPDYANVDIQLLASRRNSVLSQRDYEYIYTGGAFNNRLSYLGGGILHSSALAVNGQGVAFSAPSGTGKSTHTGLWRERFGDAVEMINDDKPAIYFDGEQPLICGTPWSGKTALNTNRTVPLKAIVIIERGETNAIRRLDTVEGMLHLTAQINRPYYDEALGVRTLDFTERLLRAVPLYCLTCNISQQAVDTAFDAIFQEEQTV